MLRQQTGPAANMRTVSAQQWWWVLGMQKDTLCIKKYNKNGRRMHTSELFAIITTTTTIFIIVRLTVMDELLLPLLFMAPSCM